MHHFLCKYHLNYAISIAVLLLLSRLCAAQVNLISGRVESTLRLPVSNVSITLRNQGGFILKSTITNEKGDFNIPNDTLSSQPLFLYATYLGYKKGVLQITRSQRIYNFTLESDAIELSEVKIKNRPNITVNSDTLSYDVNSFARTEDRHIGDVIRRLPGFTVEDDGKILYNGQAISNLYTGGDDLMGGKYGLATRSISKDMIKNVEVMKNHQPVRVLKDKVLTNDVAVNLVLRDEQNIRVSGEMMLGGGLPSQYDASAGLIALSKNFKMINTLKANNSGVDLRNFLKDFGQMTTLAPETFSKTPLLVNSATISPPALPASNYYLNNSGLVSLSNLVNTKKKWQFRLNLQGFLDKNKLSHFSEVTNYLAGDTVIYREQQSLTQKSSILSAGVLINKNSTELFFSNDMKLNLKRDVFISPMSFNFIDFNQLLTNNEYDFSNSMSYMPKVRKSQILAINWNLHYITNPQRLEIDKGINQNIFNNGIPYLALGQYSITPTFFSGLSASYIIPNNLIGQNHQLGLNNEFKSLRSNIAITDLSGNEYNYQNDGGNDLRWRNNKLYLNSNYNFKTDNWKIILNVPVNLQLINYEQAFYQADKTFRQLTINPNISVNYKTGVEDYLTASISYTNNVGDIISVYRGNLLNNYRTIKNNNADLQTRQNLNLTLKYHLEKSIALTFANIAFSYNRSAAGSIAFTNTLNDILTTVLVRLRNVSNNYNLSTNYSRHFVSLNAKIQLALSHNELRTNLFLNNKLIPYANGNTLMSLGYDTKILNALSVNYNLRFNYVKGRSKGIDDNTFNFSSNSLEEFLTLAYNIDNRFLVEAGGQHVVNHQQGNMVANLFLLNSSIKYQFTKPKVELKINLTNIFNEREYTFSNISSNQLMENTFLLRGRMAIARINYIF